MLCWNTTSSCECWRVAHRAGVVVHADIAAGKLYNRVSSAIKVDLPAPLQPQHARQPPGRQAETHLVHGLACARRSSGSRTSRVFDGVTTTPHG